MGQALLIQYLPFRQQSGKLFSYSLQKDLELTNFKTENLIKNFAVIKSQSKPWSQHGFTAS